MGCFKFVFIGANSKVKQRNTMSAQRPAYNHVSHQAKVATILLSVHTCLIESVLHTCTCTHTLHTHTNMHTHTSHTHAHHTTMGDMVRRSALTFVLMSKTAFLHSIIILSQITQKDHMRLQKNQTYKNNQTSHVQHSHHNKHAQ